MCPDIHYITTEDIIAKDTCLKMITPEAQRNSESLFWRRGAGREARHNNYLADGQRYEA